MKINLGYCCVSMLYKDLKCSRASTKTFLDRHSREYNHDYLIEKSKQNLEDLKKLLVLNYKNDIMAYRVPEQFLPQMDLEYFQIDELKAQLKEVGAIANQYHIQLSTHPSQYFVLNSLREDVVERTIHSLKFIGETFERMELDLVPNLTLHLGMKNGYESEEEAIDEFCRNFERLEPSVKNYLVLENDHVSFTVENCLKVHEKIGIPIVFDNKHYEWNSGDITYEEAVSRCVATWNHRIPKLHLSSDKGKKKHAHWDYVLLEDYQKMEAALQQTGIPECNIMLECKQKDVAVLQLRKEIMKDRSGRIA